MSPHVVKNSPRIWIHLKMTETHHMLIFRVMCQCHRVLFCLVELLLSLGNETGSVYLYQIDLLNPSEPECLPVITFPFASSPVQGKAGTFLCHFFDVSALPAVHLGVRCNIHSVDSTMITTRSTGGRVPFFAECKMCWFGWQAQRGWCYSGSN